LVASAARLRVRLGVLAGSQLVARRLSLIRRRHLLGGCTAAVNLRTPLRATLGVSRATVYRVLAEDADE
jgi:hypothetical protein